MADPFGLSFSPGGQNGPNGQPTNGQRPTPIQQAIQTLSLKIPRVAGASAFTAQPLLNSPGGMGLGGNPNSAAMLEQLRRMLFGGGPDMNGTGVTGMQTSQPSGGPDLAAIMSQLFGPQSGSGAPMGQSGSGAPLPGGSNIPPPNIFPGDVGTSPELPRDNSPLPAPQTPNPMPNFGSNPSYDRNDTQMI